MATYKKLPVAEYKSLTRRLTIWMNRGQGLSNKAATLWENRARAAEDRVSLLEKRVRHLQRELKAVRHATARITAKNILLRRVK